MALSTLLQIVQRACDELGLSRPSAVATATDPTPVQMLALLNAGGEAMMGEHHWRDLITLGTITIVSGTSDYAYPSDFDRLVPETEWDRTNDWQLLGPLSPQVDRYLRESAVSQNTPRRYFRLIGGYFRVFPTPSSSGDTLVYEYVADTWARSSGGSAQTEFQADSDTSIFRSRLHVLDLVWRWRLAKGLDAVAAKADFDQNLASAISADKGEVVLNLARRPERQFLDARSIPDSGYGS